jgi:hypothetical protein
MLKSKSEKVSAEALPVLSNDSIRINAGSFIINNTWISFNGAVFKVRDYIASVVVGNRTRFFKDRNYAVYLLICIDPNEGIIVVEGKHVLFTSIQAVPAPETFTALPLIGLILIQDNTLDLSYGFKPLSNENILFFSGSGNILDRNLKGILGNNSTVCGETGHYGETGIRNFKGETGFIGITGYPGYKPIAPSGERGLIGMTGINWDINIPFEVLI